MLVKTQAYKPGPLIVSSFFFGGMPSPGAVLYVLYVVSGSAGRNVEPAVSRETASVGQDKNER